LCQLVKVLEPLCVLWSHTTQCNAPIRADITLVLKLGSSRDVQDISFYNWSACASYVSSMNHYSTLYSCFVNSLINTKECSAIWYSAVTIFFHMSPHYYRKTSCAGNCHLSACAIYMYSAIISECPEALQSVLEITVLRTAVSSVLRMIKLRNISRDFFKHTFMYDTKKRAW
jgi:hypothetical protein